jgi:hypothetical protein
MRMADRNRNQLYIVLFHFYTINNIFCYCHYASVIQFNSF